MTSEHSTFQDNLAAYALGVLDPEESLALEQHLQTCESCRSELAGYRQVSTGLAAALPPRTPRTAVRRGLEKRLAGERSRTRPQVNWSLGQLVFGSLLAALVVLNAVLLFQTSALRKEQAELLNQRKADQTVLAMLAYPSTKTQAFDQNGVTGSLIVDQQRNLVGIFAWNLAQPPRGKTYQIWLIDQQGQRTSGGFLAPETGYPFVAAVVWSPKPLTTYTGIGVTLEPTGGSPQPTGPKMFGVSF